MRAGWSCQDAARILGVRETRLSAALNPALEKIARLWRADPTRTLRDILDAVDRLGEMLDSEISVRSMAADGRANRADVLRPRNGSAVRRPGANRP